MKKYVPVEKMSKKMRKEYYQKQRKDWGGISPVTRRSENPKAYNRAKTKAGHGLSRDPFVFMPPRPQNLRSASRHTWNRRILHIL